MKACLLLSAFPLALNADAATVASNTGSLVTPEDAFGQTFSPTATEIPIHHDPGTRVHSAILHGYLTN